MPKTFGMYSKDRVTLDKLAAQEQFLQHLAKGLTVEGALAKVGRGSRKTYEAWRKESESFRNRADVARQLRHRDANIIRGEHLPFEEFRLKYLNARTYWHQLQWIDVLEGRPPRDLHAAQTYVRPKRPGARNRILILTPPGHAKSMTITVDYVVYRLCMDPSFRVLIVSAGATLATEFLFAIKERLTSPDYADLQRAYAPDGGWEAGAESWAQSRITFASDVRATGQHGSGEKDPNVQAVGMRGRIYGKRADLIIVDDAVDGTNVNEYMKQFKWLNREVTSRLTASGKMLVIGTRIAPVDLYSYLLDPSTYGGKEPPWTHMASPAILAEGSTPEEHVTLWPKAEHPWGNPELAGGIDECMCGNAVECWSPDENGLYPRWDGVHIEYGPRADNDAQTFALVYQQLSMDENSTFPEHAVARSINAQRMPGLLQDNAAGHPLGGMHKKYVIAGCDPSVKGYAAIIILALDRDSGKRYLLNAINLKAPTPSQLRAKLIEVTDHYDVDEWRVEKTGLLQFFTQDQELRVAMTTRGVQFKEHSTGSNKWDPGFGVASMSSLFGQYDRTTGPHGEITSDWREIAPPMIELPRLVQDGLKALQHQLLIWTPELDPNRVPCDLVMALWFAEIGCRQRIRKRGSVGNVVPMRARKFVSQRSRQRTVSVDLAAARASGS